MVAESALRHLGISGHRKEKLEVFFDVAGIISMFSQSTSSIGDSTPDLGSQLQGSVDAILKSVLPTSKQIV